MGNIFKNEYLTIEYIISSSDSVSKYSDHRNVNNKKILST